MWIYKRESIVKEKERKYKNIIAGTELWSQISLHSAKVIVNLYILGDREDFISEYLLSEGQ